MQLNWCLPLLLCTCIQLGIIYLLTLYFWRKKCNQLKKQRNSLVDPIQNSGLLTTTGAFRTSTALSLCAETGTLPPHYRRLNLTDKLTTILEHPKITLSITFLPFRRAFTSITTSMPSSRSATQSYLQIPSPDPNPPSHLPQSTFHSLNTPKLQPQHQPSRTSSKNSFTHFSNQPYASPKALKLITEPISHI